MVVATGADGMALAVDSVSWRPAGGLAPFSLGGDGSWVTTPRALLADPAAFATQTVEGAGALGGERPSVLTLDPATKTTLPLGKRPGGSPPKGETHCAPTPRSKDLDGVFPVAVGELHRERGWGAEFVYTSTKSSSFQIGSAADGKGWKLAGSSSMSQTRDGRAGGYETPTDHLVFETIYAEMVFTEFEWVCGEPNWYRAYTLEPTKWTGGVRDRGGVNPTSCKAFFERVRGTSQTLEGAISVEGFLGSVSTGFTMSVKDTRSTGVGEMWMNEVSHERLLCGDREYPADGETRVVSLP